MVCMKVGDKNRVNHAPGGKCLLDLPAKEGKRGLRAAVVHDIDLTEGPGKLFRIEGALSHGEETSYHFHNRILPSIFNLSVVCLGFGKLDSDKIGAISRWKE